MLVQFWYFQSININPILEGLKNWAFRMGGGMIVPNTTTKNFTEKIEKKTFAYVNKNA